MYCIINSWIFGSPKRGSNSTKALGGGETGNSGSDTNRKEAYSKRKWSGVGVGQG